MSEPYEADHGFDVPEPPEALPLTRYHAINWLRRLLHAILLPTGADAPLREAVNQALDRVATLRLIEADWTARAEACDAPRPPCGHQHGRYQCTATWCGYGVPLTPGAQATSLFIVTGAGGAMEAAAVLEAAGFDIHTARLR